MSDPDKTTLDIKSSIGKTGDFEKTMLDMTFVDPQLIRSTIGKNSDVASVEVRAVYRVVTTIKPSPAQDLIEGQVRQAELEVMQKYPETLFDFSIIRL